MNSTNVNDSHSPADSGFRLPTELELGPVRLQVADLSRSLGYYTEVLGMQPLETSTTSGVQAVLGAADGTPLVELQERPGARAVPPGGRLGLYHFAVLLPDRESLGRFARHLGNIDERVGASDHLVSEAFYLQDPDGLGIEVYADRPRDSWRFQDGQLAMDTKPLDIRNLLQASGTEDWAGMPSGTRIGHVHLHVDELSEAQAFYRNALGFEPTVWSYPGALFLSAGGYHHHLGVNTWATGAPVAGAEDARMVEWELIVPSASDAEAVARSLRTRGFEVASHADGFSSSDPWGVDVRIRTGNTSRQ
ncbi:MAG: VOC family protein [Trueperaceae bacterium]